jgi:hypothetical protein
MVYARSYRSKRQSPYVRRTLKSAAREQRNFPKKFFGTAHFRRGDPQTINTFGASRALATPDQLASRSSAGYTGKGAYWGQRAGDWLSGATGIRGLGGLGSRLENGVIDAGMSALGNYRGKGAYISNGLMNPSGADVPTMVSDGGEGADATALHVRHREYIGDIQGSNTFKNKSYPINPGNSELFPWLSQIALNFDEYEFNQLIFGFKSVTADVTTATTQIGSVIMACNYNVTNTPFTSKIPMMEYEASVSSKITDTITYGIECDSLKNGGSAIKYTTDGSYSPVGEDPKTYFQGLFQIAVNQTLAVGQVGELWVEYDCVLRKKKLYTALGGGILSLGLTNNPIKSGFQPVGAVLGNPGTGNWLGLPNGTRQFNSYFGIDHFRASSYPMNYWLMPLNATQNVTSTAAMRAFYWTPKFANEWNVVYIATSGDANPGCRLALFAPDNYTGNFMYVRQTNGYYRTASPNIETSTNLNVDTGVNYAGINIVGAQAQVNDGHADILSYSVATSAETDLKAGPLNNGTYVVLGQRLTTFGWAGGAPYLSSIYITGLSITP